PGRAAPDRADTSRLWSRTPIDAFILHRLHEAGLEPNPPADKVTLLRRAYYDLTGLPPTPEEVDAFLADDSPTAFEKVIDRLLASRRYGERWARHWLDVVRFAETNSYERDSLKPHAWRYRDYVIRSFNDDKPYDQFIREQLAGDELPEPTRDSLIATGYYRLGIWDDEPTDVLQAEYDVLDDIISTTGQVFLGLTVGCARCHDHKIDPVPQQDYYSLLAFFHNVTPMGKSGPNIERPIFESPEAERAWQKRSRALADEKREVERQIGAIEDEFQSRYVETYPQEKSTEFTSRRLAELMGKYGAEILGEERYGEYGRLKTERERIEDRQRPAEFALVVTEHDRTPPETFVLLRGNAHVK
ncbi:MAG: DUF1549 domain-containing protein, partial [Planctomycetaceae bacterium]